MFRSSNRLIGSPEDRRQSYNGLEFTPIGHNSRRDPHSRRSTVLRKNTLLQNRDINPIDNSPLKNRILNGGSSFIDESEYDTIHQSATKPMQTKTSSPINNEFLKHDLLNNGSNPVMQQQNSIQKLQDENYGLKLKLASLTRFVNSITNDEQHEIYKQNSELQEKLIEMRGEFNSMNKELLELRGNESVIPIEQLLNQIKELEDTAESQELHYRKEINKLEENIDFLENKLANEQTKLSSSHSNSNSYFQNEVNNLNNEIRNLKNEINNLNGEIQDRDAEIRAKDDHIEGIAIQLEDLQSKVEKAESKSQKSSIIENKADEYKYLIEQKDDKIEKLTEIINSKNSKLSSIKNDLLQAQKVLENEIFERNQLKLKLKSSEKTISMLEDQLSNAKKLDGDYNTELVELNKYKINLESEIENLKLRIEDSKSIINDQRNLIKEIQSQSYSNEDFENFKNQYSVKMKSIENELKNVSLERDSLKRQLLQSDQEVINLRNNNQKTYKAYEDLRRSSKLNYQNDFEKKTYEKEINSLIDKIEELNFENEKLFKRLETENVSRPAFINDQFELKNLSSKNIELQEELNNKENEYSRKISNLNRELNDFKTSLQKREEELFNLKSKLRSTELDFTDKFDDEKLGLMKAKRSKDTEIKLLQLELENQKDQYESEIKTLKLSISKLKSSKNGVENLSIFSNTQFELNDKESRIQYLNSKLEQSTSKLMKLQKIVENLEEEKQYLNIDNKKLESKLNVYETKLKEYKDGVMKLTEMNSNDTEIESLKLELKIKEKEIEQVNKDFNLMKHELLNKYKNVTNEKKIVENKFDKLILKYKQLENLSTNYNNLTKKINYLQDQNDLFKLKYNKMLYNVKDLKFMNSFMIKSIKANDLTIKKDIKKLQEFGIYPDYDNKRVSLKALFKFVVAAVRIKRKAEYSSAKNKKMESLSNKLESLSY